MSRRSLLPIVLAVLLVAPAASAQEQLELNPSVVMRAAAVSETADGFVGSTATITVTTARGGSGHVFLDTFPLTEIDMQGSARLAARVGTQLAGLDLEEHDYFFVIRSGSQQIGGPSAGASLTVGVIASLKGWDVRDDVLMTGTISPDGTVGPVGGIVEKAAAAADVGMRRFLFPAGQEITPLAGGGVGNVTAYCARELGIECRPVSDVIEAVSLMTDHAFERRPVTGEVTGESFERLLDPLSRELITAAEDMLGQAEAALDDAPDDAATRALRGSLAQANETFASARRAQENGTYYTAASLSFQTSIDARFVRDMTRYVTAERPDDVLETILRESSADVSNARAAVVAAGPGDTNRFEALGAAQVRLMEAESRLEDAEALAGAARSVDDVFGAIRQAAWAAQRAATAVWWLQLGEGIPEGEPVDAASLRDVARDAITTAREEVAYATAVLQSAGVPGAAAEAQGKLENAEAAFDRGLHAAAVYEALEAGVRASKLLQVAGFGGNLPAQVIDKARLEAARAIQGARERGIESLVAQSAYEFGLDVEDPYQQLAFLGFARVTANLAGLPGGGGGLAGVQPLETRFQGIPEPPGVAPVYVAAAFAVGLALGAGAGLTALLPRRRDEEEMTEVVVVAREADEAEPALVDEEDQWRLRV